MPIDTDFEKINLGDDINSVEAAEVARQFNSRIKGGKRCTCKNSEDCDLFHKDSEISRRNNDLNDKGSYFNGFVVIFARPTPDSEVVILEITRHPNNRLHADRLYRAALNK